MDIADNASKIQANTDAIGALSGGSGIKVYDAADQFLGLLVDEEINYIEIYVAKYNAIVRLGADLNRIPMGDVYNVGASPKVVFTSDNCTGTPYLELRNFIQTIEPALYEAGYYFLDLNQLTAKDINSYMNLDCVTESRGTKQVVPKIFAELPFTTPISIPMRFE